MRKVSSVFACLLVTGTLLSACGGNSNGNKPAADGGRSDTCTSGYPSGRRVGNPVTGTGR
ncbi:hypothetical protein [Paenibacillus rhizoplanae]|uniref:hypothetical protein n=1 Tax=Paenibacillus rhizoplanae TaxID=1917181 RepID=UPI003613126C